MGAFDDDNEDETVDTSPAGLRSALEKANARAKAAEKAVAEQTKLVNDLTAVTRVASLEKLLGKHTTDPSKFASFVGADVTLDEAGVAKWVEDNKSIYAFGAPVAPVAPVAGQQAPAADEQVSTNPLEGVDMNLVDQLVRMGVIADRSQAVSGTERQQLADTVRLADPKSLDDAKDILKGLGIEVQDTSGYNPMFSSPRQ